MAIISAFADEIDPSPNVQIKVLNQAGIDHVDLRGAWGVNVMKLSEDQRGRLKERFDDAGVKVACIGSPIGKIRLDDDLDQHFEDFKHAVELTDQFECHYIRIFSFYPPQGQDIIDHRQTVIDRLQQMCEYVKGSQITLVLENESDIYGDKPEQCLDLMRELQAQSPHLVMAFDPANFVVADALPVYETCWQPLRDYVGYFHIKDRQAGPTAPCVPCGQGAGDVEKILADAAKMRQDWILTLEPHLKTAGQFAGSTGADLFKVAARALIEVCDRVGMSH